ncbi:MAG: hypothetical protein Tsb0020_16640 [Haliangiales bacterium]
MRTLDGEPHGAGDEPGTVAGRLTRIYLVALGLIALLVICAHGFVYWTIAQQGDDAAVINVAGRQRMLSQRIAKCALAIRAGIDRREELVRSLEEWSVAHQGLRFGDPSRDLPGDLPPALREMYIELEAPLVRIEVAATALLRGGASDAEVDAAIDTILANERQFLPLMHQIVGVHEQLANDKLERLQIIENTLLIVTLLLLLIEAGLIFRPAIGHLRRQFQARLDAEAKLSHALERANAATTAKAEFLANMSHELRTPLNSLCGMSALLEDTALDSTQREYVRALGRSAGHLLALVNDVLDLATIDAGELALAAVDFAVADVVAESIAVATSAAQEKPLTLVYECAPAVPALVRGDPVRLKQVLLGLLSNAVKFSEEGTVQVSVDRVESADDDQLTLQFDVRDTGVGIPEAQRERLFEAFTQGDGSSTRQHGGIGVGLAIAKRVVSSMDGSMSVWGEPGAGTTVRFTAVFGAPAGSAPEVADMASAGAEPASTRPDSGEPAPVRAEAGPESVGGYKTLLVEDDAINRVVAQTMLERCGHRVDVVGDGRAAVDAVLRARYDLVFMDIQMPVMNGLQATRAIRALSGPAGQVCIVALTANAFSQDRDACVAAGMNAYLSKPITREAIAQCVAELRARGQLLRVASSGG